MDTLNTGFQLLSLGLLSLLHGTSHVRIQYFGLVVQSNYSERILIDFSI